MRGFVADHVSGVLYPVGAVHLVPAAAAAVAVLSWAPNWPRHRRISPP